MNPSAMVSAYGANKNQIKVMIGEIARASRKRRPAAHTSMDGRVMQSMKSNKSSLRKKIGCSTNMDIMDIHINEEAMDIMKKNNVWIDLHKYAD